MVVLTRLKNSINFYLTYFHTLLERVFVYLSLFSFNTYVFIQFDRFIYETAISENAYISIERRRKMHKYEIIKPRKIYQTQLLKF